MSSVLATRKVAGEGNYFVVAGDASASTFTAAGDADTREVAAGTLLKDLGKRVVAGDKTLAKVVDSANAADPTYVCVKDVADAQSVQVSSLGAGIRN